MQRLNVVYKLENVNEVMEEELKDLVENNLEVKMSSSLKKIYSKWDDVKVLIRVNVSKEKEGYNGNFKLEYDGKIFEYDREWFEILADLVNHAFENFKQRVLAK